MYSNQMVRFSKRVNFDIGCNMDFTTYPVDLQKCFVTLESFGYTIKVCSYSSLPFKTNFAKELLLQWREREGEVGPLVVSDKIMLPHYNHSICLVTPPLTCFGQLLISKHSTLPDHCITGWQIRGEQVRRRVSEHPVRAAVGSVCRGDHLLHIDPLLPLRRHRLPRLLPPHRLCGDQSHHVALHAPKHVRPSGKKKTI